MPGHSARSACASTNQARIAVADCKALRHMEAAVALLPRVLECLALLGIGYNLKQARLFSLMDAEVC